MSVEVHIKLTYYQYVRLTRILERPIAPSYYKGQANVVEYSPDEIKGIMEMIDVIKEEPTPPQTTK